MCVCAAKTSLGVPAGEIEQRPREAAAPVEQRQHHLPLLHPVHRHVDVVARARGVQPAGDVVAARVDDQPLDVEEQVLAAAVVRRALHVGSRRRVERIADGRGVGARDDPLLGEHHQVRIVNRHQRRQELRLGVLEVLVEDEAM